MAGPRLQWGHRDTSGNLSSVLAQAIAIAKARTWTEDEEGNRLFRAFLLGSIASIANLGPSPARVRIEGDKSTPEIIDQKLGGSVDYVIEPKQASRVDSLDWQNGIAWGLAALINRGQQSPEELLKFHAGELVQVVTIDGKPAELVGTSKDIGALPVIGLGLTIVICTGILAAAGLTGWLGSQVAEVAQSKVVGDEKAKTAAAAIANSVEIVENHRAVEQASGTSTPYDQGELNVLESLRGSISQVSGWQPPPMKSVPNVSGATSSIGAGIGIGTAIALAIGAWLLTQKGK